MNMLKKMLVACVVLGLVLAGVGYLCGASTALYLDENYRLRVPERTEPVVHEIPGGQIRQVLVDVGTADVLIGRGQGETALVEIQYQRGQPPECTLDDGVLSVKNEGRQSVFSMGFFMDMGPNRVTITLPQGDYDIQASSGTGWVQVADLTPGSLAVTNGTGGILLERIQCGSAWVDSGTGSVALQQFDCADLWVESATGGVKVEGALQGRSVISSSTGSVRVHTSLPAQSYRIETSTGTGRITAPQGSDQAENLLQVTTGTGNITVECG